ncbi:MAG: ATP-binding protein [Undibacterium sp.]|nr:ATP-binding protein [Undibacterium sp.]
MQKNQQINDGQVKKRFGTVSLRNAIVLGIALGIVLPALLVGVLVARDSYQRELDVRIRAPLLQYASMLQQTMAIPVWHVDKEAAQTFVNSVMLNPDVVKILVEDASLGLFVEAERPELRGTIVRETRSIQWDGLPIGRISIEMSSQLVEQEFLKSMIKAGAAIFLQLLISFVLLLMLFQRRMMRPLQQLQLDVDRLAEGKLEQAVQVGRADELGNLAQGVDSMRARLGELMKLQADHSATLEQRVIDRTLALHTTNQELRETLDTLKNAQMEIQRSDRLAALGSLVAGVAHELNTPIGNCVTVASTLQAFSADFRGAMGQGISRSTLTKYVDNNTQASDMLLRNLQNAAELIGSFKRVAVDRTSAQRRQFKLDEVVRETVLTMGAVIRRSSHQVHIEIDADIQMDAYPGPLGQIISNLINNALIHGFEDDGQAQIRGVIRISAHLLAGSTPAALKLIVSDNGAGISAANLGRIFDPFFTTKLGQGGSGLGLNIVYNLVNDVFGGKIRVESSLGQGASFIMTLPLIAPSADLSLHS